MEELKTGERLDDLQFGGLRIIQNSDLFCFGTDSVLLTNFVQVKRGDVVADLGCGTGIIAILIAGKHPNSQVFGLEIQDVLADMAQRSVALNNLENVTIIKGDLKEAHALLPFCQVVVCNPPYERLGTGMASPNNSHRIARHEFMCTFEDVVHAAYRLLGDGGRFYFINRAERVIELTTTLMKYKLQPKAARFIHANIGERAKYVLMGAVKNGGEGMQILPPLILYDEAGNFTRDAKLLYGGEE